MENVLLLGGSLLSVGTWALASWMSFSPLQVETVLPETRQIVAPDKSLLDAYERCSRDAEIRLLSYVEARKCSLNYLELKVSLLPDVDLKEYESLSAVRRQEIDKRGYLAFLRWREHDSGKLSDSVKMESSQSKPGVKSNAE